MTDFITLAFQAIVFLASLFVPGYALTRGFLPNVETQLEKIVFGFGMGIAFLPLFLLTLNQVFGIPINTINALLVASLLTAVGVVGFISTKRRKERKGGETRKKKK